MAHATVEVGVERGDERTVRDGLHELGVETRPAAG
jgi:hypothetical protein